MVESIVGSVFRPLHGGNLQWAASIAGCDPSAILDFSASINPLGPPQGAIAAIQAGIATLRDYPDPDYRVVRSALSQIHQIDPAWILPGNGSAELLTWACRDLAALEATYLVTPAFSDYFRALNAFDAKVIRCPFNLSKDFSSQSDRSDALPFPIAPQNRSGLLLNNPHNPTGHLFPRNAIVPLLDQFEWVVVDEAFMDFLPDERLYSVIEWVERHPNLIVLRSLTKFYSLPGLRFGYAIAHPDVLNAWQKLRDPWSVNALASIAAEVCLNDRTFQQQTFDWLSRARSQLSEGLAKLPGFKPFPGVANYLLVQSEKSVPDVQQELLKRHKILIRDCLSFPELGDRYFRVAVRLPSENQRLIDGLADVVG